MLDTLHTLALAHPIETLFVTAIALWFGAGWASKLL